MKPWAIKVAPVVWGDLAAIETYYREVAPEQIARFREQYKQAVTTIRQWPYLNEEDRPSVRHFTTAVFPYNIFYTIDEDTHTLTITAVLHQRRDPALAILRTP